MSTAALSSIRCWVSRQTRAPSNKHENVASKPPAKIIGEGSEYMADCDNVEALQQLRR